MILAGTGHRPERLGGYEPAALARVYRLAHRCLSSMRPARVISGMAQGWDLALARAAVDLGIPFTAAVPFRGQEAAWKPFAQAEYHALLDAADLVHVIGSRDYHDRNRWMVDNCDRVLALWDGTGSGTGKTVAYAREMGKPITNAWPRWLDYETWAGDKK